MAERLTLGAFIVAMLACLALDQNVIYGLLVGLVIFFCYARHYGLPTRQVLRLMVQGVRPVLPVLSILLIIGVLTSAWRSSGTIPFMIYQATGFINPGNFTLACFLLCSAMSVLTGTSFGTAGTLGVICMTLGQTLGMDPLLTGGAVLSGIYFGDRCSPMSSSAHLVCTVTQTNIYHNIVLMCKSAWLPFLLSCLFYGLIGGRLAGNADAYLQNSVAIFAENYRLHWTAILPALSVVLLSLLRVDVKINMAVSILIACLLSVLLQGVALPVLLKQLVFGYEVAGNAALAALMDGGGLLSIARVILVVPVSAMYFGIFRETPLLTGVKQALHKLARHISAYGAALVTALFTSAVCCNQTLPIMLTGNMCEELLPDNSQRALTLENTAVIVAPLVPWNVAGMVPLLTIGAPPVSAVYACYLYLIPLCSLIAALWRKQKQQSASKTQSLS